MASDEAKKIDKEDVGSAGSDKAADTQAAAELLFTHQVEKHLGRLCEIAFSILRTGKKIDQARFTAELAVGEKDTLLPLAKALKADGPVFAKMIKDGVCMRTNGNAPVLIGFLTGASSYEEAVKIAKDASGDDPEEERRQEEERLKRNKEVAARKATERAMEEEEQRKNAQKAAAVPLASTATSAPAIPGVPATDSVPANSALEGASENVEQSILKFIAGEQIGASEQRIKDYLGKGSLSKKQRQELLARLVREDRLEFKDGNYRVKKEEVLAPKVNQTSPASAVLTQTDPANSPDASKIDAVKTQPTTEDVGAKKKQDDAFLKEFTTRLTDALTEKLKDVDAAGADVKKPVELATPEQIKEEGNKLDLLVEDISDLLDRVAKGRKIGNRLWKKIGDGFSEIHETAAMLEHAGLVLPPRGKEAMQSLEATIEARDVEDPAKARDGIRLIERLLRDEFHKQKAQSNLVEKSVSVVTAGGELPAPSVAVPRNEGTKQISSEIQELVKHAKDFRDIFLKARDRGRNGQKDGVGAIQGMRKVISQIEKLVSGLTGEEKKRFQRDVDSLRDEYLSLFDEKFLPGAVPSEAKKGNLFVDAKNFNELHAILEKLGSLVISGGLRTASQLIDDIEEVRNGRSGLERITRTGGLRSAVERILAIEASINSNAPKSIPGSEDVESGVSVDTLSEQKQESALEHLSRLRAGAFMVQKILERYATDNKGAESPVAGRLMKRLITELLSDFESNRLKPNLQLMQLVAKIRGAIREHDDPRFERNNGKQVSFVELAADITAALTSQSREEYKKWADENPDSLKKDFFNREGNELKDISETVALWLNELAGADSLDAATREEITKELLVFQQKAHKNLNDWAEQRSLSMAKLKKIDPTASAQASVVASAPAVAAAASPVASSILTAPAENLPSTPLAVKLENGEFKTTMTEAFSNSDFMSFFEAFDAIKDRPWFKGKLYGSFDPKTPFGEMRFERALEAYAQWRNAVAFFEREAKDLVTQKLGIPPEAKAFAVLPEALRNIAIKRPAELTRLMEASVRYHEVEEDIARNEEYLIQSAPFDRAKVESMVADAAARVEALSKTHAKILHERNVLREELDRGDRGFLGRIRDIFRRPESKILRDHSLPFEGPLTKEQAERAELLKKRFPKGFAACMAAVRGDEQQRTHEEAREIIGKDEFSEKELAGALAESHKEYRALSKMLDEAMEEYAKVEREYQMVLKHRVKDRESALQTKDALTRQLEAMQLGVLQLGDASKVVSEEASNSARDIVRGILTDEQTPDAVVRADRFISAVRAAGARPEAGAAARDLLAALEIDIRSALEKRFAKTLSEYRPGSGKIREIARLFATYGDRGQEAAKRAMTSAIEQAQQSGDADRRLAYKALQVEYQTELLAAKEREKKAKEGSVKKTEDKKKKAA